MMSRRTTRAISTPYDQLGGGSLIRPRSVEAGTRARRHPTATQSPPLQSQPWSSTAMAREAARHCLSAGRRQAGCGCRAAAPAAAPAGCPETHAGETVYHTHQSPGSAQIGSGYPAACVVGGGGSCGRRARRRCLPVGLVRRQGPGRAAGPRPAAEAARADELAGLHVRHVAVFSAGLSRLGRSRQAPALVRSR